MAVNRVIYHLLLATICWTGMWYGMLINQPRCRGSNSAAAIGDLRTLHTAQTMYFEAHERYGTPEQLRGGGLLNDVWFDGCVIDHYRFSMTLRADGLGYEIRADSIDQPNWWSSGGEDRFFYVDETGEIRLARSRPAGPTDPPAIRK